MSKQPLVSVIIIFYNEERFLQEAIDSVFDQTYTQWELLLVDDGSTDGSSQIALDCAAKRPERVRYLTHPQNKNLGMSASRSLGVARAKGSYIAYIDGDDVWLPHKLYEQVAILEAHPDADLVFGPLQMWHSWRGRAEDIDYLNGVDDEGTFPFANSVVEPPKLLTLFLQDERYIPSGFLVRSHTMQQTALYEANFRDAYSDAVALVKLCLHSRVFVSDRCWYRYRKHKGSFTYRSWINDWGAAEQRLYWEWVERYLRKQGAEASAPMRVVQRGLARYRQPLRYKARKQMRRLLKQLSPAVYSWLMARRQIA